MRAHERLGFGFGFGCWDHWPLATGYGTQSRRAKGLGRERRDWGQGWWSPSAHGCTTNTLRLGGVATSRASAPPGQGKRSQRENALQGT